jgi:hypothetical protein
LALDSHVQQWQSWYLSPAWHVLQVIAICAVGVAWLLYLRLLNPIASRLEQVPSHMVTLNQMAASTPSSSVIVPASWKPANHLQPALQHKQQNCCAADDIMAAAQPRTTRLEQSSIGDSVSFPLQGLELLAGLCEVATWGLAVALLFATTSSISYRWGPALQR